MDFVISITEFLKIIENKEENFHEKEKLLKISQNLEHLLNHIKTAKNF